MTETLCHLFSIIVRHCSFLTQNLALFISYTEFGLFTSLVFSHAANSQIAGSMFILLNSVYTYLAT